MTVDSFKTIRTALTLEMKEKGSRFICHAVPAASREGAEAVVVEISKKYFDATHNCYAWRIGAGAEEISRFSDDGEPSGTAGKPILQAITGADVTNTVVIVTRYFGGTKLGTGGLIRAYGGVAADTLAQAQIVVKYNMEVLDVFCAYRHLSVIMALLERLSGRVIESEYSESIRLRVTLRSAFVNQFIRSTIDSTAGQVKPHPVK